MTNSNEFHYTVDKWNGDPAADRDKFIGGSDAGTILGLNPFQSAYTLWAQKTGLIPFPDLSDKLAVWFGTEEEEIVAKRFCVETGKKVRKSNMSYGIEEYPFLRGHVDRLVVGEDAGLECKTTGSWNKTNYLNGEIPPMHYAQVQFYMLVTGKPVWYYAVKKDNNQFYQGPVQRDDEYISEMLPMLVDFWKHVQDKEPVDIDGSRSTTETLSQLHPGDSTDTEIMYLGSDIDDLLGEREQLNDSIDDLKESCSQIDNQIKDRLGDTQKAQSEHFKVSWINAKPRETIDSKRLRKEYPDVYEECKKIGSASRRFTVTRKKEDKE